MKSKSEKKFEFKEKQKPQEKKENTLQKKEEKNYDHRYSAEVVYEKKDFFKSGFAGLALTLLTGIILYFLFAQVTSVLPSEFSDSGGFRTISILLNFLLVFLALPFLFGFFGLTSLMSQIGLSQISLIPAVIAGAVMCFAHYGLVLSTMKKTLEQQSAKKLLFVLLTIVAYLVELIMFALLLIK